MLLAQIKTLQANSLVQDTGTIVVLLIIAVALSIYWSLRPKSTSNSKPLSEPTYRDFIQKIPLIINSPPLNEQPNSASLTSPTRRITVAESVAKPLSSHSVLEAKQASAPSLTGGQAAVTPDYDKILAATANSPFTAKSRTFTTGASSYAAGLPADTYTTCLDQNGDVEYFGFTRVADGKLVPELVGTYTKAGKHYVNGVEHTHKAGDTVFKNDGVTPATRSTGMYLRNSEGTKVRLFDSIINTLAASPEEADRRLYAALTSSGTHDVFFTGASRVAVVPIDIEGRAYKKCVLRLMD